MKILIFTQKVNKNDPVLGFFHRWLLEFSKHFEHITVVCLEMGEYDLPKNIEVLSLGKEKGFSRFIYILNFYKYIFTKWTSYNSVFVHMNQEYVLLGGLFWRLGGKKVAMWRNHPYGNFFTSLAVFLSNIVLCTSKQSFVVKFQKTKIMPVGIDTNFFTIKNKHKIFNSVIMLGRVSVIKNVHIFVEALKILAERNVVFRAAIVGFSKNETNYENLIKNKIIDYGLSKFLLLQEAVENNDVPDILSSYEVFVNATPAGSYDKVMLEAMSCGILPAVSNPMLAKDLDSIFIFDSSSAQSLADCLERIFKLTDEKKRIFIDFNMKYVSDRHSLATLGLALKNILNK